MSHDMICGWLGLPAGSWPPNHYVLLGLPAGEADVQRIEERVHERLLLLRQYQLNQPDPATEAMNRVAQAFACLTDPEAKQAYDAQLRSPTPLPEPPGPEPEPLVISPDEPDPLAWLFGPWGAGGPTGEDGASAAVAQVVPREFSPAALKAVDWTKEPPPPRLAVPVPKAPTSAHGAAPTETAPAPEARPRPYDAIFATARNSRPARRGLGTRRALYHRIADTRELLWHWKQIGKYLNKPTKRLTRLSEATELSRHLTDVLEMLPYFPPLLGNAGQPGYLVIVLARQPLIIPTFRSLLLAQREKLAEDWRAGHELLAQHRQFLREELHKLRRKGLLGRWFRAASTVVTDYPEALLAVLSLIALSVAVGSKFIQYIH